METIERRTLLYKSKVEYGDYALNHVLGCSHGCLYPCYAYLDKKRWGQVTGMGDWKRPRLVENADKMLIEELKHIKDIKTVQMCFTTDPFMMDQPEIQEMTVKLLKILHEHEITARVLTKGIYPPANNLPKRHEYGISCVTFSYHYQETWEPGAAIPMKRINSLRNLSQQNYYTWISMEPYPTPNLHTVDFNMISLKEFLHEIGFVRKIIFGRWNYNSASKGYEEYYEKAENTVREFCVKNHIECVIKQANKQGRKLIADSL